MPYPTMPIPTSPAVIYLFAFRLGRGSFGCPQRRGGLLSARAFQRAAAHQPGEAFGLQPQRAEETLIRGWRPEETAFFRGFRAVNLHLAHISQGIPASERVRRCGPAGELGHRLCALRVTRPRLG